MPILNADYAKNVIVVKRGKGAGFSGIENHLFFADNTRMLYGDGQAVANELSLSEENIPVVVRVAIQRPLYKLLDYSCSSKIQPEPGCRVKVSLGNSIITAIVVETGCESEFESLKPIQEIIDHSPLIDQQLLGKERHFQKLKFGNPTSKAFELADTDLNRAPKQRLMLDYLKSNKEVQADKLKLLLGDNWRSTARELIKKELVDVNEIELEKLNLSRDGDFSVNPPHQLTDEQQQCLVEIEDNFNQSDLRPILLHGITGSGKTEVYLSVIAPFLEAKKQVLVLIPEIGLTPQLLSRFRRYFPDSNIDCLHSGLADGERTRVWLGAKTGNIDIVIGTRSAVFTPLLNPGMILIDEEHDASFKQQEGFLYQGRDMAIKRAYDLGIPILLGSATPSLESLYNVEKGRYHYLCLNNRPGASNPPDIALQDIRTLPLDAGISSLMMTDIRQHLDNNNQVMLFLNRRGFAPVLMCQDCGWHAVCNHCDMGMTYHAAMGKVICHHCGFEERVKTTCPDCNSTKLTTQGQGTERIEEVLNTHFPEIPVIRIDRDSTSRKGSLEKKLEVVNNGDPVILIGTQMLTKGHDFPKLTLVGILDVDQALFSMDYRAHERLAQQVLQVAGRAGRGEAKGRVILQTSQPQHPMLLSLLAQGYSATAQQILNERKLWNYPPLGCQALVRVNALDLQLAQKFINTLSTDLTSINSEKVMLLGPMPSPLARRAKRYRFQLLISAEKRGDLHGFLHSVLHIIMDKMYKDFKQSESLDTGFVGGSGIIWMFSGIVLGLLVGMGMYYFSNDKSSRIRIVDSLQKKIESTQSAAKSAPSLSNFSQRTAPVANRNEIEKPKPSNESKFSYYAVLPTLDVPVNSSRPIDTRKQAVNNVQSVENQQLAESTTQVETAAADEAQLEEIEQANIGDYLLQVASFKKQSMADKTRGRLSNKGIDALRAEEKN
ncbi:Primosomal protein N' [Nymphon striatum]|nr:Primosomal protein N' [Nymphon striatum]